MDGLKRFIASIFLVFILIGITTGQLSENTQNLNNTSISSFLTNNTLQTQLSSKVAINTTIINQTFNNVISPIYNFLNVFVLFLFVALMLYGAMLIMHGTADFQVSDERKMKAMMGFIISSGMVLLLIPYMYIYFTYFPQIIQATAPSLLSIKSPVPTYILWLDLFVSVILALFGFLLAIKEYIRYIQTYQGVDKEEELREAERTQALHRVLALTAFMFLSPLVIGAIFTTLTGVFIGFSSGVSQSLFSVPSLSEGFKFQMYQTNYYPQCTWNPASWFSCEYYSIAKSLYGVGLQATVFNATFSLMTTTFGQVSLFMIIYDLIVLILMVYSFAKIDWYSLQYLATLKSGEEEARNYNKLKNSYIQYISFILSPILFIIALIILNSLISVITALVGSTSLSPIPPLLNLVGEPTAEDLVLSIAGYIMALFGVFLLLAVLILVLLKILGGIIFAVGIFLYFSEDIKYKMFGKNLLIGFVLLYIAPLVIYILYSLFFGMIPSIISQGLGYGGTQAISVSLNGYYSKVISSTNVSIFSPSGSSINVNCVNSTSIENAVKYSNGDPNLLGVLLGSCENFVGYWSNGYNIIAFLSILILILLIFGLPTLIGFFGSFAGLGTSGFVSLTKGIKGKPRIKQISTIVKNLKYNTKSLANTGKSRISKAAELSKKVASTGESLAYLKMTAPIQGTSLGSVLNETRARTLSLASNILNKVRQDFDDAKPVYLTNSEIEKYATSSKYKMEGEKDSDAIKRFKKELKERYGVKKNKYGIYEMTKGNLRKLENDKNYKFDSNKFIGSSSIFGVENKMNDDIEKTKNYYDREISKAKKNGDMATVRKLQDEKKKSIDKIKEKYYKELDEIAKKENFKSYKNYKKLVGFMNDLYDVSDKDFIRNYVEKSKNNFIENLKNENPNITESEIKEKLKNEFNQSAVEQEAKKVLEEKSKRLTKVLKQHGLGARGEIELNKIIKESPEDLSNLGNIAFNAVLNTGREKAGFNIMVNAIKNHSPSLRYKIKTIVGDTGKELTSTYLNPLLGATMERLKTTKEVIGDLKDFVFVSGVPVYAKYNEKISEYDENIKKAINESHDIIDKLKDPNLSASEKNELLEKLNTLKKTIEETQAEKKKLEYKVSKIDHLSPILKGVFKGSVIPSFANYRKMLSSDEIEKEIGTIDVKKKLMENEARIIENNINKYKTDLENSRKLLSKGDLTEYQKTQIEKSINDIRQKLTELYNAKVIYQNTVEDLSKSLNGLKEVRKNQQIQSDIYASHVVETIAFDKLNEMISKDKLLSEIKTNEDESKKLSERIFEIENIASSISSISDETKKIIKNGNLDELDLNKIKIDEQQKAILSEIKDKSIGNYVKNISELKEALNDIKENKINDAIQKLSSKIPEKHLQIEKILNAKKDTFVSEGVLKSIARKQAYDEAVNTFVKQLKNGIEFKKAKEEFIEKIKKSVISISTDNEKSAYKELVDVLDKEFEGLRENELAKIIASEISKNADDIKTNLLNGVKDLGNEIELLSKSNDELVQKFGVSDLNTIKFGKLMTYAALKQSIEETEQGKVDFEILKRILKNKLKESEKEYGFSSDEIEKISSFDNSLFNSKTTTKKYLEFIKRNFIPLINDIKTYNKAANILEKIYESIEKGVNNTTSIKELDNLAFAEALSSLSIFFERYERALTNKKPEKIGFRTAKIGWRRASFNTYRKEELESGENKNDKKDNEESGDFKLEPTGERKSISESGGSDSIR